MAYECLDNIIGITQSDCDCNISGLQGEYAADWYKTSTSGLFLDQLEGIVPLKAVDQSAECTNEMAAFYYNAIKSASKTLADDILIGLTQRAINGQKTYRGKIAGTSFGSATDLTGIGYAGIKLQTRAMKGGSIKINKVNVMMNATATFNLLVYKLERGATELELVTTISNLNSTANANNINTLTDPVIIQLSEYGADFFFLYQPAGFFPRANTLSCGCGSVEYLLKNYLYVSGVTGNDLTQIPYFTGQSNAMGISLEGEVGCDTTKIICESYNNDEAAKLVMAYATRYKAGELVQEFVSKSGNINRYTMVSQEYIWGKRNHFKSEYNSRVNWLVTNLDLSLIDCYTCNDKRVVKGGILA